jgi:hypothetical protein
LKGEYLPELINKKSSIVAYENNDKRMESVYSKRIRAGKRRTYFFDVRTTKGNDYYLTITESRKRFNDDGYDRHKIFLYKEDFNKFIRALDDAITYVKTDLMPDFDFDAFNHDNEFEQEGDEEGYVAPVTDEAPAPPVVTKTVVLNRPEPPAPTPPEEHFGTDVVDKW